MATFAINNLPWRTAKLLRARLTDASSATVVEAAATESPAGKYSWSTSYSDSATAPLTVEVREVTSQDTAGFNASTTDALTPRVYADVTAAESALTPFSADINGGLYASINLPFTAVGTAPGFTWTITDANNDPLTLAGKTLRFIAAMNTGNLSANPFSLCETSLFKHETGSGVTLGGAASNVVTVQIAATNNTRIGLLQYWLYNVTDNQVLAAGRMPVVPAALNYP